MKFLVNNKKASCEISGLKCKFVSNADLKGDFKDEAKINMLFHDVKVTKLWFIKVLNSLLASSSKTPSTSLQTNFLWYNFDKKLFFYLLAIQI